MDCSAQAVQDECKFVWSWRKRKKRYLAICKDFGADAVIHLYRAGIIDGQHGHVGQVLPHSSIRIWAGVRQYILSCSLQHQHF